MYKKAIAYKPFSLSSAPFRLVSILACLLFAACSSLQKSSELPPEGFSNEAFSNEDLGQEPVAPNELTVLPITENIAPPQKILLTLARAYPGKISEVKFIRGDWTMLVNGQRFYYAHGRFLPEYLRADWKKYSAYDFYTYPWRGTLEQRIYAEQNPVPSVGTSFLFDALYITPNLFEDEETLNRLSFNQQYDYKNFLGLRIFIHPDLKLIFDNIQNEIRTAAKTDPAIQEWIDQLDWQPYKSWYWRSIKNTNRRSNHSYGIAIDLLLKNLYGGKTYYLTTPAITAEITDREIYYIPPDAVIRIFEKYGFLWGGNWDGFDTMHFEYRPEILLINNIPFTAVR